MVLVAVRGSGLESLSGAAKGLEMVLKSWFAGNQVKKKTPRAGFGLFFPVPLGC